jgi:DNA-directed RNA polymerase subunit RPC12/RpoP
MYFIPQDYKCSKCGHKFKWSIHADPIGLGEPFCPECYFNFIKANVPMAKAE